jgi:5-methylcytosine-specific restriction endonuclease McrA
MDTLVLSQGYEPVARVHWQRAVTLLFMGKVEVIEEYEDQDIKSVTFSIKMPSVVRFIQALRSKRRAVKFSRENICARDNGRCQYCNQKVPRAVGTYDHVIPRAHGGLTNWENVVWACASCNQKKGGRTPAQARMKLLSVPVKPAKLPDVRFTMSWKKDMPVSWQQFLTDFQYWNGELEQ